jgi:cation:H+ antiporter
MIADILALAAGLALAGIGGELFVRGLVGITNVFRIAPAIAGLTLAAFATSSPELSVSVNAALDGRPQLGLGDALGSNVVNVGLILGLALIVGPIAVKRDSIRRDFPVAVAVPFLTALLIIDGQISQIDGLLMLSLFLLWLTVALVEAWRGRNSVAKVLGDKRPVLVLLSSALGFAALLAAGWLIVKGGTGVGAAVGLDPFIVGATIVAIGTSLPELATTVISRLRGHAEIGLGTVLGSNIFNGFFIVSVAAIIHPIAVGWQEVLIGLGFGALLVVAMFPRRDGNIGRRRGVLLLAIYAAYVAAILQSGK